MELNKHESEFRAWLKSLLKQKGCEVTNIESSTKNGIPDMFFQHPDFSCWLELKVVKSIQESPMIRPEQRVWLLRNHNHGGCCFLVVYVKGWETINVYHPNIELVSYSGKFLRVLDKPLVSIPKRTIFDVLKNIHASTQ